MLEAIEHNWGLIGPGDWYQIKWEVFYDGSYKMTACYKPSIDDYEKGNKQKKIKKCSGKINDIEFAELKKHLDYKQWIDPRIDNSGSCDGTAWEMKYYSASGTILNNFSLGYIYGHECLEKIVACLPKAYGEYGACAFVSVEVSGEE